jgi:hypothetical protein
MIGKLCLGLALPLVLNAAQQENLPAGWIVYTSKEGGFSVALPAKPAASKQRVATATGHLDVHLFIVETKDDAAYVVSYSDLPAAEIKAGTAQKRLDHARDGAVDNARGKLRTEKKIELAGFPGRELIIETDKDVVIKMRIIAAKRRLYQTMAMGSGAFFQSKNAGHFLDSLKLIK